ncbi:MAG: hypothetical protein IJA99_00185 [Oscillospiraceae bacterium]|nr:hypothetical protein [Oscillospiraceae bacterium]
MFVVDDSDMKIAAGPKADVSQPDDGEAAAMEFLTHKTNGNIEKAYGLGKKVAESFFAPDGPITRFCENMQEEEVVLQKKVLFTFVAELVFHNELASVVAETAEQELIARIGEKDPETMARAVDSTTRSYYQLGAKKGRVPYENMGKAFAKLCGKPNDEALSQLGQCLTKEYAHFCHTAVEEAQFH